MKRRPTGCCFWKAKVFAFVVTTSLAFSVQAAGPLLTVEQTQSNVVVRFTGRLQSTANLRVPFKTAFGSTSPYLWPIATNGRRYWRSWMGGVKTIVAGYGHSAALKGDGTLWEWGRNNYGQLGNGTLADSAQPLQVGISTYWTAISGRGSHVMALDSSGALWTWGLNVDGQMGIGTSGTAYEINPYPVRVGVENSWALASAGGFHTAAIKTNGSLWAWGDNAFGQLGNGSYVRATTPVRIGTETNWTLVTCGTDHTLALKTDGSLWAWGMNLDGQLGIGPSGSFTNRPTRVGSDSDWTVIACGRNHTVALKADGSMWAWGYNSQGELGLGYSPASTNRPARVGVDTDWTAVAAGDQHTAAVKADGSIWMCGWNIDGELGNGRTALFVNQPQRLAAVTNCVAVACGAAHTVALGSDASLLAWGYNFHGQAGNGTISGSPTPVRIGLETNWVSIASCVDANFSVARKADGSLWIWGDNSQGALGNGTLISTNQPGLVEPGVALGWAAAASGGAYTAALGQDGSYWAWGDNSRGQLGVGSLTNTNRPARVGSATNWAALACGFNHTVALKTDGSLWTCGGGSAGELGLGALTSTNQPGQVGLDTDWSVIACGSDHTLALKADRSLWAWGDNYFGQLGFGTATSTNQPVRVGSANDWMIVRSGYSHTAAIKSDGSLWTWGYNGDGQLGLGTSAQQNSPVRVGTAFNWKAVACGNAFTAALKADGSLWAWGRNDSGQLGIGTFTGVNQPTRVGTDTDWIGVACGDIHTLALKANGTLWAWGENYAGQAAQPVCWTPCPVAGAKDWWRPQ